MTDPVGIRWQSYAWGELLDALRRDLQLDASTDLQPGSLDALGWLQFLAPAGEQAQVVTSSYAAPAGWSTATINLPQPFPNAVDHVFWSVSGAAANSIVGFGEWAVLSTSSVTIDINSTALQTVSIHVLALGH